jgi:alpha-tubulin N-acetyltransferase 1
MKFFASDHKIYMKCEGNKVIGFIKIGIKKLFIRDEIGNINEIDPLCVLDFYVHEDYQRNGHGKVFFI